MAIKVEETGAIICKKATNFLGSVADEPLRKLGQYFHFRQDGRKKKNKIK